MVFKLTNAHSSLAKCRNCFLRILLEDKSKKKITAVKNSREATGDNGNLLKMDRGNGLA